MRVLALPTCPACGSATLRAFDVGDGERLQRCADCGTVSAIEYADPAEVYVDGYMFGQAGDFGLDVRAPAFQDYLRRVSDRRVRIVQRATGVRGGDWLDVGAGTGELLAAARARGWRVQGVEPERSAAEMSRARGLPVIVSELEGSGLPERSFDVVSAVHVLEHIPDSRRFLSTLARWARPGGHVVVEVPNFAAYQRRRLGSRWPHLRPREHLVHFTPATLAATARAAGLAPVAVRSPVYVGPPQDLAQALWDLGRPAGRLRRVLAPLSPAGPDGGAPRPGPLAWPLLRGLDRLYDAAGAGAVVLCVARAD
ncbi:MAG TPA: methyltransferase domain-containing protein [Solirubrobacteraceae bacterium]|nr:methyltransferase domain-containing protein [Solirubrobacteraceae bacterium]